MTSMAANQQGGSTNSTMAIEPEELRIVTQYPAGNTHIDYLIQDYDLSMHVEAAGGRRDNNGRPIRYHADEGMVLFVLGVDGDNHDQVRVQTGTRKMADMIEVLKQTIETAQRSLDALHKIKAMNRGDAQ